MSGGNNNNNNNNKGDGFGRDEMMAMLGGGLSETLTRRPVVAGSASGGAARGAKPDLSDMTTAETAAMLLHEQQSKKKGHDKNKIKKLAGGRDRHRTQKVRAYHQLLHEEAVVASSSASAPANDSEEYLQDDREDEFQLEKSLSVRPSHPSDSSSSSSEEESDADHRPRRRRVDSSSSSDSDEDDNGADARRKRLLVKLKGVVASQPQELEPATVIVSEPLQARPTRSGSISSSSEEEDQPRGKPQTTESATSSSSSDESTSEDSSSSSDDDDEIAAPARLARPVFIPRHKRSTIQQQEAELQQEEEQERQRVEWKQKRKQESRAMVQQVLVATAQAAPDWNDAFEGITSARTPVPDDSDDIVDAARERDEWEVRELVRLIEDWDIEQDRLAQERELARRRQMTDEERLQEDRAAGRFKKPGEQHSTSDDKPLSKRYYHKGAFYMDEDEFAEDDIRLKAAEYARAATASDKTDKKVLPKVMQVKKFGFANQSKYKGLAAEDTTDRRAEMLPLKRKMG